ncbi:MAG: HypC/HybG/HupF family hydrogenase formation chaperone [Burkholderiales bacterium]|nr:HypC/HybG/HupF family hydrogenase formation chaperone [Burkholderiales bacterium]
MCIGIPMQAASVRPGFALCEGRGERREVSTALIGEVAPGDWLLVFLDSARERISAARAAEVDATLDLVLGAMAGEVPAVEDPAFALPSSLDARQLAALVGGEIPS